MAKDKVQGERLRHQVMRQAIEDVNPVGLAHHRRIDAPVEPQRGNQAGKRQQQPQDERNKGLAQRRTLPAGSEPNDAAATTDQPPTST